MCVCVCVCVSRCTYGTSCTSLSLSLSLSGYNTTKEKRSRFAPLGRFEVILRSVLHHYCTVRTMVLLLARRSKRSSLFCGSLLFSKFYLNELLYATDVSTLLFILVMHSQNKRVINPHFCLIFFLFLGFFFYNSEVEEPRDLVESM